MKEHKCNSKEKEIFTRKIEFLDGSKRREDLPPEKLLNLLPMTRTDTILDLGAGTGYLTLPAAKEVDSLVYALDRDPNMLEIINTKAQKENLTNIKAMQADIDHIRLSNDSIGIVLASLVLHETKTISKTLQEIKRVLKESGYFVCVEIEKLDHVNDGPPRISSSIMEQEITNAGMDIIQKFFPTDSLYVFIARK
ncbi:class I SAM-dependent methyltransferase [Virgibacillus sp. M23]|uniref:class I SAM-dependent methyltransferase n=1 Tax=Virgibacillus sp. M23 TaxID=3079030 RepID=UPI002A916AF4|nr:class I SAM-dependent methyltransferase [Virgibacillus sp. M23]MDY7045805.1 class I SAM-dependent methyltransferase [Virgibacillus sp. M23]